MSRVVRVSDSNYKIATKANGSITLDTSGGLFDDSTGKPQGTVFINGDLEVRGATSTVESTNVTIADNVIVLSSGTLTNGLPASVDYQSGIEIDRGSASNAQWVFDENISWTKGGASGNGTFTFRIGGQTQPIHVPGISSNGTLYIDTGNQVISVTNTNDYEEGIFTYDGGGNIIGGIIDDDNIPNAKAVADYVSFVLANTFQDTISENDTSVSATDFDTTGSESAVVITVDGVNTVNFYKNRVQFDDIHIIGNEISTTTSNTDLVLEGQGNGAVRVKDSLLLDTTIHDNETLADPAAPTDGVKIYSKAPSTGNTGIYYKNQDSDTLAVGEELISNNRSLLYSMLF